MNLRIGIVGAGNMGAGIAQKYAMSDFDVTVVDVNENGLMRGKNAIENSLDEAVARRILRQEKRGTIAQSLHYSTSLETLKGCDLVIEAIFEDLDAKRSLFQQLDAICDQTTILATNTSSFLLEDISVDLQHPARFLGLHYFFHPAKNKLVEVIPGPETSEDVVERAWHLQEQMGKLPIRCKDTPGFVVNRFFVPWLNEAMRVLDEGLADIPTIEWAAKQIFGIGMGPFELMNVTGVPITFHAANALASHLGTFYSPCGVIHDTGKDQIRTNWTLTGDIDPSKLDTIQARLVGTVVNIATTLVYDEQASTLEDVDLGARVGLRWAKGPFELANSIGIPAVGKMVHEVSAANPSFFTSPSLSTPKCHAFPLQFVDVKVEEDIGIIQLNKPDAMNALDGVMIEHLNAAFTQLSHDDAVNGIVIVGRGKAFVAGADIKFFVDNLKGQSISKVIQFAMDGQKLFQAIDESKKPVVCAMNGLALGGGLELALACDMIVATNRGMVGFPETGIGIYPGLGGTQRTPRKIGLGLAKWLILSGEMISTKKALDIHLIDEVVDSTDVQASAVKWAKRLAGTSESQAPKNDIPAEFNAIRKQFEGPMDGYKEALKRKAPVAIQLADELLNLSQKLSLSDGLKAESERLDQVFKTKDALNGLSSVGKKPPVYLGT